MKKGKSLTQLAQELEGIRASAKDFIVPTEKMAMEVQGVERGSVGLSFQGTNYGLNNWSHSQVSTYTNIPKAYYDRILTEDPFLLSSNVNHGFGVAVQKALLAKKQENRLIRIVNGNVRAILSSRYRRLDCYDLVETVLPVMQNHELIVESAELTERRMYIKAFTRKMDVEIKKGQVIGYGLNISCSDVGSGAISIEPMTKEYVCSNGMIWDIAMRKFHIGANQGGDSIEELLTDKTKELDDMAFWAKVVDVLQASLQPDIFAKQVDKLRDAADQQIKNFNIPEVVELSMKEVGATGEGTKNSIINYLANGADGRGMNKWGLANAFTFAAQSDEVDYEMATVLEKAGAKIIELPRKNWEVIAG
jgi:hypothetical protein